MLRQLLIIIFFSFGPYVVFAVPDENQTLVVPTDSPVEKSNEPEHSPDALLDLGLENRNKSPTHPTHVFHLAPSSSATIALHQAYDFNQEKSNTWFGIHVAPWMSATHRVQLGLDIYDRYSWLQAAYHVLPTRGQSRFYWGGGMSSIMDSREDFRSLMKLKNFYAFAAAGWDLQIYHSSSVRFEASFHQSTEYSLVRGTVGYTIHF
jgi:hypothetical protein